MKCNISKVTKQVSYKIFRLQKLRRQLTENLSRRIYKQTILPILDYCSFVHNSSNKNMQQKLDSLQNRALRVIVLEHNTRLNMDPIRLRLGFQNLHERRDYQLVMSINKCRKRFNLDNHIPIHARTRAGYKLNINLGRHNTTTYERSPLYLGTKIWNDLPYVLQRIDHKEEFKTRLKMYLN